MGYRIEKRVNNYLEKPVTLNFTMDDGVPSLLHVSVVESKGILMCFIHSF